MKFLLITSPNKRPLDPITFEVIRHRMWQITNEMGAALIHISGSPVVTQVNDIMTGIFLSGGEPVSFGPYVVLHFGCNPFAISAIIEQCGTDPGIEPDDMFMVNDPLVRRRASKRCCHRCSASSPWKAGWLDSLYGPSAGCRGYDTGRLHRGRERSLPGRD